MKRKRKSTDALGLAKTLKAAVGLTRLPLHIVQKIKDAGCKAFKANGTVDCDALMEAASALPDTPDDEFPDYYVERAKRVRASRLLDEQKLRERDKLLWAIEVIRRGWFRNVITAKKKLYAAEHEISAQCALRGFNAEQSSLVRDLVAKHNRGIVKELFAGEWGKCVCPNCKVEVAA